MNTLKQKQTLIAQFEQYDKDTGRAILSLPNGKYFSKHLPKGDFTNKQMIIQGTLENSKMDIHEYTIVEIKSH